MQMQKVENRDEVKRVKEEVMEKEREGQGWKKEAAKQKGPRRRRQKEAERQKKKERQLKEELLTDAALLTEAWRKRTQTCVAHQNSTQDSTTCTTHDR